MALPGFTDVIGTEFGEVDNPAYGGYTEPNWNKGAFGESLSGWGNQGFALPPSVLKPYGYGSKGFASDFNKDYEIQAYSPTTGQVTSGPLKDIGPGAGTGAGIDMLAGSRQALGLDRNFSGSIQYRIVPKGTPTPEDAALAANRPTFQPTAATDTATAATDPATARRSALLANAMKIYQATTGGGTAMAPGGTQAGQSTDYASLNLPSIMGAGGGGGINYGLIDAIRRNRAAQALQLQQALKGGMQLGGQLAGLGGNLWGQRPVDTLGTLGDEPLISSMGV
jgi:hypothetical protein